MNIDIICVGKIREKYISDGINEFLKRLTPYCSIKTKEIHSEKIRTENDEIKAREIEGEKILSFISDNSYNIVLYIEGKEFSSIGFGNKIKELEKNGNNQINFIIGGATGLSEKVVNKADLKLSFSKMTFPHQLMRLILLEQLYRAFKIINNEPYHK